MAQLYTKCIEIAWIYATEFVPLDLASLMGDIKITSTTQRQRNAGEGRSRLVLYNISSRILSESDGARAVEITYPASDNPSIPHEDDLWGVATIVIPLKAVFAKQRRIKQVGMTTALQIVGLPLDGSHHRGLDDALNLAKLLPQLFRLAVQR